MRIDYKNTFNPRIPSSHDRRRRRLGFGLITLTAISSVAFALSSFERGAVDTADVQPQFGGDTEWSALALPPTAAGIEPQDTAPNVPARAAVPAPIEPEVSPNAATLAAVVRPTPMPAAAPSPTAEPAAATPSANAAETAPPPLDVREHRIRSGESLASIFKRMKLSATVLHQIVTSDDEAKRLARVKPGQLLRFHVDTDGNLQRLELERDAISTLRSDLTDDQWQTREVRKDVERRQANATGTIESSLFVDGQKAGLADAQIMELATIFGWDIDFALEIRAGDRFSLVYEAQYLDGEKFANGPILAAEFVNRGTIYRAVRFEDSDGNVSYYDADGRNKRRAFIRTPVKFARISSGFTNKRWHPVLKRWRSHKGVDYAAPRGTPIKATGTGKVEFRGNKGGYGRTIVIRHGRKYTTLYAHLSKYARGIRSGSKVKQGQVIGYVGSTGLATGPHLHYEFRVNGAHRNPLRVKLPKALPLPKSEMTAYLAHAAPLLVELDGLGDQTLVADATDQQQQ